MKKSLKKQFYRVKNKHYHHGFLPNIDVIEENIGYDPYRFIQILGFKIVKLEKLI